MPKDAGSEGDDPPVFCNVVIMNLVRHGKLSKEVGIKITQELYELSGLSITYVRNLVYGGKISAAKALSITHDQYFNSALSYPYIQILVERDIMLPNRALSIKREEVENPIPYLSQLGNKRTPEQTRKLELYECEPNIAPDYVERIILLEFKEGGRHPSEEMELALLLDPAARKYATQIVKLSFFSDNTLKERRELNLLLDPYSRCYADSIADLEFKENKSVSDEINLEILYLRVCCKLPKRDVFLRLFQAALISADVELSQPILQGCHFQNPYQNQIAGLGLMQNNSGEENQIERMKTTIEKAAKEIVLVQLDVRGVEARLRETDAMQKYVLGKTDFLRHVLMKYFVGFSKVFYSKEALDDLKEKICENLRGKVLTLSDVDKILSLPLWIDKKERSGELSFALR